MFQVGKHKGRTVKEVYEIDKEYLVWFYEQFTGDRNDYIGEMRKKIKAFFRELKHEHIRGDE